MIVASEIMIGPQKPEQPTRKMKICSSYVFKALDVDVRWLTTDDEPGIHVCQLFKILTLISNKLDSQLFLYAINPLPKII